VVRGIDEEKDPESDGAKRDVVRAAVAGRVLLFTR
jgi:hypothetical protein